MFETKQYSEVITRSLSAWWPSLFTLGRGRNCKCNHSQRMCVLIAILHVPYTFWWEECRWFFQLNGNSCFWVMCLMEAKGAVCCYLLWPQPWKGEYFKRTQSAIRRQSQRSSILRFPEAKHGMLHRVLSFNGKDAVCVGHRRAHSWDFTGQHISVGGFTSDYEREKETN